MATCSGHHLPQSHKALNKVYKLLSCVKCGNLPQQKVFMLGNCEHKYCETCVDKVAGKQCCVCKEVSLPKEAAADLFTTNLLTELRKLEQFMKKESPKKKARLSTENETVNKPVTKTTTIETPSTSGGGVKRPVTVVEKLSSKNLTKLSKLPKTDDKKKKISSVYDYKSSEDEEEELLSVHSKSDTPLSKSSKSKQANNKRTRKLSSDSDDDESDDEINFSLLKNKATGKQKQNGSTTKGKIESKKSSNVPNPTKVIKDVFTQEEEKVEETIDSDLDSDLELFEDSGKVVAERTKLKSQSPPCLTPYVKVQKLEEETPLKIKSTLKKRAKKSSKGAKNSDDDDEEENKIKKGLNPQTPLPPPLTPYGKVTPLLESKTHSESDSEQRKSKRSKQISKLTKTKDDKPKERNKKSKLVPLNVRNSKTPDDSSKSSVTPASKEKSIRSRIGSCNSSIASTTSSPALGSNKSFSSVVSVDKKNAKGETLLHVACRTGQVEKAKELILAGADINCQDFAGWTPLHEAINGKSSPSCKLELVQLLCSEGCNTNIPGMDFESALHEAARGGLKKIVKCLLQHSASPNVRNKLGKLPRDVTTNEQIISLLDEVSTPDQTMDDSAALSIEDPIVFEIQLAKAMLYFNYSIDSEVLCSVEKDLKLKVSKILGDQVTHMIFGEAETDEVKVPFSFDYLYGVVSGVWMLSSKWIDDSVAKKKIMLPKAYEVKGCLELDVDVNSCKSSRMNKELGNPGLFHGISFYFYKNCSYGKVGKKDLTKLIYIAQGNVINREPNPTSVDPLESPVRFHAQEDNHKLVLTSHIILFDDKNQPPEEKKLNMEHIKCLNVQWLIDSIGAFQLMDPEKYL